MCQDPQQPAGIANKTRIAVKFRSKLCRWNCTADHKLPDHNFYGREGGFSGNVQCDLLNPFCGFLGAFSR
jgi:hypothetical protein